MFWIPWLEGFAQNGPLKNNTHRNPSSPKGSPEQLDKDALPGLDRGGLVGEGGLEEGGDDVRERLCHVLLQRRVRVFPAS